MKRKLLYTIIIFFFLSVNSFAKNLKFTKIIDLDKPWGSSFINNNELIISEKSGKIKIVNIENSNTNEINHNLNFLEHGQGGLLDIIYKDGFVWISYTEDRGNLKTSTSIAKGKFNRQKIFFKNIFQANPPIDSGYHFGSRLAIKGNYIFASLGERGQGMIAQDVTSHPGSIIRIHLDGTIPIVNPKFKEKKKLVARNLSDRCKKSPGINFITI